MVWVMAWQVRHQGSPRVLQNVTLEQIAQGLRDGALEATDEVMGPDDTTWTAIENHPGLADVVADLEPPEARYHAEATSLDMNALIDVCLVLLIFFILTTTYAAAVQKVVPMPTLKQAEGKSKARVISREDVKRMIRVQTELDRAGKPAMRIENQTASVFDDDGGLDANKLREALQ